MKILVVRDSDCTVVAVFDSMYEFECSEFFEQYESDDAVSPYSIRFFEG